MICNGTKTGVTSPSANDASTRKKQMDIDYMAIITKANERKDRLMDLSAQLEQVPEMVKKLEEVQEWATHVADIYRALDQEGCALLPQPVCHALEYATTSVTLLKRARYESMNDYPIGIRAWRQNV